MSAVHHEQRQTRKECRTRTQQNISFCREDFARALSKPNSIAVSLTVPSQCNGVTIFNESPLLPIVQGHRSCTLPGSFQKTSQAIFGLQQMNRVSNSMSKCTSVIYIYLHQEDYSPPRCAIVFWLVSIRLTLCVRQNKHTLYAQGFQADCDFCPKSLIAVNFIPYACLPSALTGKYATCLQWNALSMTNAC